MENQESQEVKRRSRFINDNDLIQVDLGDGDWVKIPTRFSYAMVAEFSFDGMSAKERADKLLFACIKEWNLVDENGVIAQISQENISRIEISTLTPVITAIHKQMEGVVPPKVA